MSAARPQPDFHNYHYNGLMKPSGYDVASGAPNQQHIGDSANFGGPTTQDHNLAHLNEPSTSPPQAQLHLVPLQSISEGEPNVNVSQGGEHDVRAREHRPIHHDDWHGHEPALGPSGRLAPSSLKPPAPSNNTALSASDSLAMFGGGGGGNNNKLTVRVLVDSQSSGRLLGKGGGTVKRMRQESQAWIDIASLVRGAARRVVTVKGNVEQSVKALLMIAEQLARPSDDGRLLAPPAAAAASGAVTVSDSIALKPQAPHTASQASAAPASSDAASSAAAPAASAAAGAGAGLGADSIAWRAPAEDSESLQVALTLLVHNQQVGCIIGKAGAAVRETRERSGAMINVSDHTLETSSEKTVTVKGTLSAVRKALQTMIQQLFDRPDRASTQNLYVPSLFENDPLAGLARSLPASRAHSRTQSQTGLGHLLPPGGPGPSPLNALAAAASSGFLDPAAASALLQQLSALSALQQAAAAAAAGPNSLPVRPPLPLLVPQMRANGPMNVDGNNAMPGGIPSPQQTIMVPVPEHMIGCVIGRRGSTIRDIRMRSRAQVSIAESAPNANERLVTITGTRPQTEVAVALIYEKINMFQANRPSNSGAAPSAGDGSVPAAAPAAAGPAPPASRRSVSMDGLH